MHSLLGAVVQQQYYYDDWEEGSTISAADFPDAHRHD